MDALTAIARTRHRDQAWRAFASTNPDLDPSERSRLFLAAERTALIWSDASRLLDAHMSLARLHRSLQKVDGALTSTVAAHEAIKDWPPPAMGPDPVAQRAAAVAKLGDTTAKMHLAASKLRDEIDRARAALRRAEIDVREVLRSGDRVTIATLFAELAIRDGDLPVARQLVASVEQRRIAQIADEVERLAELRATAATVGEALAIEDALDRRKAPAESATDLDVIERATAHTADLADRGRLS